MYLAQNQFPQALQWFDAALQRNPELGEAHYYKGLSHSALQPPRLPGRDCRRALGSFCPDIPKAPEPSSSEAESKARDDAHPPRSVPFAVATSVSVRYPRDANQTHMKFR